MKAVDLHNHVFPQAAVDAINRDGRGMMARVIDKDGRPWVQHDQGYVYPLEQEFHDPVAKAAVLDRYRVDVAVLSPAPPLFYYWAEQELAVRVARMVNDAVAEYAASNPARYRPMASLPMPYPDAAVAELERVVHEHGVKGVILGTSIEGTNLADPRFRPVLKRCAELGVWVLAHPYYVGNKEGLQQYYLTNLVGNPVDTLMCGTHLIFGGVLEALPELRVVLAHGGGLLPYLIGRLTHGHMVREEAKVNTTTAPKELLHRLYFDSILFDPEPLRYLVNVAGADRVVLGSDAPFDMGDPDPRGTVERVAGITEADLAQVLGAGAASILMGEQFG